MGKRRKTPRSWPSPTRSGSRIAVTDAHFSAELQCKQLESIRFLKPDILISIPVDTKDTAGAFRSMADSGAKLVFITNVPEGLTPRDYVSCISVNERSHGDNMGRGLGEYMVRHGLKYAGLICHGEQNFFATRQRDSAAEQVLTEEYPEVQVCGKMDFLTETEVYEKTLQLIRRYPEIQALYVSWDQPALRVIRALKDLRREDIVIFTTDLDTEIAQHMEKGIVKGISTQRFYEQGRAAALAAAKSLVSDSVPKYVGVQPYMVEPKQLGRAWKEIFHTAMPAALENPRQK